MNAEEKDKKFIEMKTLVDLVGSFGMVSGKWTLKAS